MVDSRPYRRDTITLFLLATTAMHRSVFHSMGAVMPALRKDLDISATLTNAHVSAIALGMMAMGLVAEGLRPDLSVSDHLMSGMSGTDWARELQAKRPGVTVHCLGLRGGRGHRSRLDAGSVSHSAGRTSRPP